MCCTNKYRATCGRRNNGRGCGTNGQGCCGRNTCNSCTSANHLGGCNVRSPIAVTLGTMAYGKYQGNQAQQQRQIQPDPASPTRSSRASEEHLDDINAEVLKNAGIEPPSYESAMDQSPTSLRARRAESVVSGSSSDSSSDSSSSSAVIFTPATTVADPAEASNDPSKWRGDGSFASKKDMKKAFKAARKAEKWARKARALGLDI